jgi:hypothetical protein
LTAVSSGDSLSSAIIGSTPVVAVEPGPVFATVLGSPTALAPRGDKKPFCNRQIFGACVV